MKTLHIDIPDAIARSVLLPMHRGCRSKKLHTVYHMISMAKQMLGQEFAESVQTHDICDISGKGGSCGV